MRWRRGWGGGAGGVEARMRLRREWGEGAGGVKTWANGGVCTATYTIYIESYMVADREEEEEEEEGDVTSLFLKNITF